MKKIKFFLSSLMLMFCTLSWGQNIQVTGTVTDSQDGQPLPGAYIVIKGTSNGQVADANGKFAINCAKDATLVFTFVGYQDLEVAVNGRSIINASMASQNILEEVVVTALGITRDKKSLGHAIQEVKGDQLTKAGHLNMAGAIAGKVAGLQVSAAGGQVGAGSRFVIRGNSSLGNNEPLFVVDGIPITNDQTVYGSVNNGSGIMDINPDDIESISVLKGGAGALYGMRAGNGVILITTKSGKNNRGGVSISYDGSFTVDQMFNIPEMQNKYGQGYQGSEYDYNVAKAGGFTGTYQQYVDANCYAWGGIDSNADESWGPRLDVGLLIPQINSPIVGGVRQKTPWISQPNNINDFLELGYSMNHNVSVLGKSDKFNVRASLGVRDQKGAIPNTDQKRYSAQINARYDINKLISFDLTMNYAHTHSDNLPMTAYNAGNPLQSMLEWFGRQVDMKDQKANWEKIDESTGKPYSWNPDYHQNPYYTVYKNTNTYDRNRLFGKASLWLNATDWLKFEARLGYDYYGSKNLQRIAYNTDQPSGGFYDYNMKNIEMNADAIAYINKSFADEMFNVSAVLGANFRDAQFSSLGLGANALIVPELYTVSNASGAPYTAYGHSHIRSNSLYANASIGFKSMVYLDVSVRNDWSSTIKDPFFYPGVSLSWIPTATFEGLKGEFLEYLKIRGGWAKIGSATSAYQTDKYYSAVATPILGQGQFYMPTTLPPAGLRPESVVTAELGLEAHLLKNRIGLDLSLYSKVTSDQILSMAVARPTGYSTMMVNAGEFSNKGIEVQLRGTAVQTRDVTWDVIVNWSKDYSTVNELYTDPKTGQRLLNYQIGNQWSTYLYAKAPIKDENGKITKQYSWGTLYGYGHATDDKGNIIVDASGFPKAETKDLGEVTPNWLASLSSELRYKDFSFGFMFDYRHGGKFFSVTSMWGQYTGILKMTAEGDIREREIVYGVDIFKDLKFVKEDGSPNDIKVTARDAFPYVYSDRSFAVADGSFLKLRELHLTYQLPASKLPKNGFVKGFNVSLIANNVAILWLHPSNYAKIDPESGTSSGNSGVGLESGSYMPSRSVGLKVGLTF